MIEIFVIQSLLGFYMVYLMGRYERIEEFRAKCFITIRQLIKDRRYNKSRMAISYLLVNSPSVMLKSKYTFGSLQKFEKEFKLIFEA